MLKDSLQPSDRELNYKSAWSWDFIPINRVTGIVVGGTKFFHFKASNP